MQTEKSAQRVDFSASVDRARNMAEGLAFRNSYQIECFDTLDLKNEIERLLANGNAKARQAWIAAGCGVVKCARLLGLVDSRAPEADLFELKWADGFDNLVVNTGLDEILDKFWKGSGYTAAHYVGLLDAAVSPIAFAAADDEDTHAGWTEVTAYSEANRQTLTLGTVSGQSVDNSASKAAFSINATANVEGALVSTSNDKTPPSPITGILISAGAFTGGFKAVDNGDTLNVTVTLTAASA